jgi:inorganic phosphate transporter, PiT family
MIAAMSSANTMAKPPLVGFVLAAALLLLMKWLIKRPELHASPKGNTPPPLWIRSLLILTCTGVSFAHGSTTVRRAWASSC